MTSSDILVRRMKRSRNCLLWLPVAFIGGLLFGCWDKITWNFSVPFFSAISLIVTVCVTIYVAKIIQRATQYKNSQNQLLTSKIGEVDEYIRDIESTIHSDGFSYKGVVSSFKELYLMMRRTHSGITKIYPQISQTYPCAQLLNNIQMLENLATYTPRTASPDIKVEKDKVTYSSTKRNDIMTSISNFRDKLFQLEVDIYNQ